MYFINWGEESQEQKRLRDRLEQEALYEKLIRMKHYRDLQNLSMFGENGGDAGEGNGGDGGIGGGIRTE